MDAFGDEEFAEVKYKTMNWWQCGILMVAETVSLGILSLPGAVAGIGMAPAVVILIGLGLMATYTGYVIGQFKWKYPQVCNMADAGEVMAGPIGREVLGVAQMLFLVFIMASHILTFSVALNTITEHGTCTIVFGVVGLVVSFICSLPRTLEKMSWLSLVCSAGPLLSKISYGIALPTVSSPAPYTTNSPASQLTAPQIVIAGVINGHVAFKLVYVRIFAGTDRMHKRDWVSVGSWIAIGLVLWIIAWIIAEAIPVFDNLLSLIVALFASWFTYGLSGIFWLYMNWGLYFSSWRKTVLMVLNVLIFGVGAALCGLGLYVSGKAIHDNTGSESFSCAA
ncbi:hypothetical protein PHISP_05044 [Aspergillus sp. HF37]|nr:hypothetical protein PHISP_05044 [Aspergillus sp. HF37]